MSDTSEGDTDCLDAEKKNGVYLLEVEGQRIGYTVRSATDTTVVEKVTINGRHIGTSGYFETECDGFEITEDGTLNLRYADTDTSHLRGGE